MVAGGAEFWRTARTGRLERRRGAGGPAGVLLPGRCRLDADGHQRAVLHGRLPLQPGTGAQVLHRVPAARRLPPVARGYRLHAQVLLLFLFFLSPTIRVALLPHRPVVNPIHPSSNENPST